MSLLDELQSCRDELTVDSLLATIAIIEKEKEALAEMLAASQENSQMKDKEYARLARIIQDDLEIIRQFI